MSSDRTLSVVTHGDREIVMTRFFAAPRARVFEAWTRPELVRRWLLGPPGWSMVACEIDLRAGGRYRYAWRHDGGAEMGMGGTFREVVVPQRIVATEAFDQSWYPGAGLSTIVFVEEPGGTRIVQTMRYDSAQARDIVLRSPMESGVAASFDRLAELLPALPAELQRAYDG